MSGHATLILTGLAAAAALATAGSMAGLATSAAAAPASTTLRAPTASASRAAYPLPGLSQCGQGKPVVRRRAFIIFCGDAGEIAAGLHWTKLTASTGTAVGLARANQCTPTCAAGHFKSYRARYVFSRVRIIDGEPAFTFVRITYTGKRTPYGHRHQSDLLLDGSSAG